ncbi:MAG: acyl-CoA/acyl-ACP dehydrogenase [Burkholderiales bacterium]|nr:acyl-CoA/acyl-ACP dehydrogenase [Burkholderiales bacterium]MDE2394004.1 acyl-CoA/acyl-ACP dehydrogenase [Burkholderiales bacterium]MDE2453128.1 acyl-CoA/acyl-ACP dehydrogenase [Burkholderiales bacterium]
MGTDSWELPEELRQLQDTVGRFMAAEVKPAEDRLPHDAYELPAEALEPLQAKAREIGLWCLRSPAEHGGAGLSLLGQAVVAEEAAKCRMGAYVPACGAFGADPPNAIYLGTEEQVQKYAVPGIRQGKKIYVAISESSGGADPARSIRARAVRQGDKYLLNGSKMWITGAQGADWGIVFARTGEQGDRGGISCFIVNGQPEGMTMKPIPVIRSYSPYEITFKDVEIPLGDRLGEEGKGFAVCEKWLVEGRIPYAAGTIGIAQAALQIAIDWARERETFRSKLADKQAVQWMVANSEIELRAARLLVYQAAWIADLGRGDLKVASSIAKVVATETAGRVVDRCIQILGALGVAQELPLERWYRELRIKRIGEGPSEVHRMVLARQLLGVGR